MSGEDGLSDNEQKNSIVTAYRRLDEDKGPAKEPMISDSLEIHRVVSLRVHGVELPWLKCAIY